jgi:hypothetical protein
VGYRARKDWWISCVLLLVSLGLVGVGGLGAALLVRAGPGKPAEEALPGLLLLLEGVLGGLLLWAFFSARYEITTADLVVRFGPLVRRLPLGAVEEVLPQRGFALDCSENLALSGHHLRIRYRQGGGRLALLPLVISPADQEGFLAELARALPGLRPGPDGAWRRTEETVPGAASWSR